MEGLLTIVKRLDRCISLHVVYKQKHLRQTGEIVRVPKGGVGLRGLSRYAVVDAEGPRQVGQAAGVEHCNLELEWQ